MCHFADRTKGEALPLASTENYIHIWIHQRNNRKTITTVQGISEEDNEKALEHVEAESTCNDTVTEHQESVEIIKV